MSSSVFFFSSRRRHTRFKCDWSSDVCSSDLSRGAAHGDGADEGLSRARLSGGAAGLRQRRIAADDERWRAGAEADESRFACAEDLFGEDQRETGRAGDRTIARGNCDRIRGCDAREVLAGENPAVGGRGDSPVRSDPHRRTEPADSADVSERGLSRGKNQARAIGAVGSGCGAGKISCADGAGSGEVEKSLTVRKWQLRGSGNWREDVGGSKLGG